MEERQSPKLIMGVRFTQLLPAISQVLRVLRLCSRRLMVLGYHPFTVVIRVRISSGVPFAGVAQRQLQRTVNPSSSDSDGSSPSPPHHLTSWVRGLNQRFAKPSTREGPQVRILHSSPEQFTSKQRFCYKLKTQMCRCRQRQTSTPVWRNWQRN